MCVYETLCAATSTEPVETFLKQTCLHWNCTKVACYGESCINVIQGTTIPWFLRNRIKTTVASTSPGSRSCCSWKCWQGLASAHGWKQACIRLRKETEHSSLPAQFSKNSILKCDAHGKFQCYQASGFSPRVLKGGSVNVATHSIDICVRMCIHIYIYYISFQRMLVYSAFHKSSKIKTTRNFFSLQAITSIPHKKNKKKKGIPKWTLHNSK